MIETKGFSLWPFLLLTLDHFDCIVDNFCLFSWHSSEIKLQANMFYCCLIVLFTFKGHKNRHGIFGGLIFGPVFFLGFAGSPRDFFVS